MNYVVYILLFLLIVCCVAVAFSKKLLNAIVIYMSFSMIMSVIWFILEAPDLAITEAAVGAGIDTILFFICLKKIHEIKKEAEKNDEQAE